MTEDGQMKLNRTALNLSRVVALLLFFTFAAVMPALANAPANQPLSDPNAGDSWNIRNNFFLRNKHAADFGPTESGGTDAIQKGQSQGPGTVDHAKSGPIQLWPVVVPALTSTVPSMRDTGISKSLLKTTGYPVSDTQFQLIERMDQNIMMEQMSDPERSMWQSTAQAGMQSGSAANSAAGMTTNQGQSAIQFQEKFLKNFTSEAGNRWLLIRDQLFIPIAVLLLLPGAVLCQVKAIVAQGSNVLGETSPFEGIFRSIIAIFMIPGTLLVINYGIDVSNSVHFTIADEYTRIFGTDMYHDAQCALWRAFPVNAQQSNKNAMKSGGQDKAKPQGQSSFSSFEALNLDVRRYDPCATPALDESLVADEDQNQDKLISRMAMNGTNVALTATWNILCAFQEAFLFYLFCMGPIAAALWVWPVKGLRSALPSWVEGVIILCFWSLFWNTVVLLMACFRGVSDTGTIIMSALNFLSTIVTQYAFDFVGLVTNGASSGVSQAIQQQASKASQAMGGGKGGGGGGHGGGAGAAHGKGGDHTGSHSGHVSAQGQSLNGALTAANSHMNNSALRGGPGNTPDLSHATGVPPHHGISSAADAKGPKGAVDPGHPLPPGSDPAHPNGPGDNAIKPPGVMPGGMSPEAYMAAHAHDNDPGHKANNTGLHLNNDGSLSVMGPQKGEQPPMHLTENQQKQLADQLKAMGDHDAASLKTMAGQQGSEQLAQAQLSAATQAAIADGGKNLQIGADGHQINAATGEALKVGGVSGIPPEGMAIGNAQSGMAPVNGAELTQLHAGQDARMADGSTLNKDQINGLATDYAAQQALLGKDGAIDPERMSMLQTPNGGTDIMGKDAAGNLTTVATAGPDGNLYAPGTNGNVMMNDQGQWVSSATGTALQHEGNKWEVAGLPQGQHIGFDATNGHFKQGTESLTPTDFAKAHPDIAHVPAGGEFNKPEAPTNAIPGVNEQVAFSQTAIGTEGPPAGAMQGLTGLAQHEGANSFSYNQQGNQLYADANGHHIAHYDAAHQQWVATDHAGRDTNVVLNQGQFDSHGGGSTHGQWVDSHSPVQALSQDGGQWHVAGTSQQYNAVSYEGGAIASPTGQTFVGHDAVQNQSFQQLAQSEHLSAPQMTADGHHVFATDSHGTQHVLANEVNGTWVASAGNQGATSADVVMNSQGQWVAPGSSTPLAAHETASGGVSWSAQAAPEVHYNPSTHMMETAGGYAAPANAVTPDMVSHIHNAPQQAPEILASAGHAGQQLQALASQEGAGQVHMAYDAQHHLQAVGDNNQVVANYNTDQHRWEAAGSGGQVVQNSAGDWVSSNSTVNNMAGGTAHIQADGHGHFVASGSAGSVASYDTSTHQWTQTANHGVQHLADQMHAGPVHLQSASMPDGSHVVQAVGADNHTVVASYDSSNQRWETNNGTVVQDANGSWVANNQYTNTAQETPVSYMPQASSSAGATASGWTASNAPEIAYNQGNFTTYSGSGQPEFSMSGQSMTPDMVNYVHQNPQQVEGLQNLAQQEHLSGPVQIQTGDSGQVQASAGGQQIAHYDGREWVADHSHNHVVEDNSGRWVTADASHTPVETHDAGHSWRPQAEPQMPSSPPTSHHPNPTVASAGFGAGATALGAWGAMKRQSQQSQPGQGQAHPTKQELPMPNATAQNTSLTPQERAQRESDEKKRKKLLEDLKKHGPFGGPADT